MKKRWNVAMGVCFVAMGMVLSGCTAKADKTDRQAVTSSVVAQSENSASEVASSEVTSAVADQNKVTAEKVRVGALKGPTSLGMLKMMEDDSAKDVNYAFQVAGSPDEIAPKLVSGDVDIIAAPVNMGSVLYNKTQGKVRMLAINTLGVLYIGEKGESDIKSIADLKGKTIYATGKGASPEYVLNYLLQKNGLDMTRDVTIEWKNEATEVLAAAKTQDKAIVLLPQPYMTAAQTQIEGLNVALDLTKEWDKTGNGSKLITAGIFTTQKYIDEHPDQVKEFLEKYKTSAQWVNGNVDQAAALAQKYDIIKEGIAKKAIPYCNITYIDGDEMKKDAQGYLSILADANKEAVGGNLPADDFYYVQK